MDDDTSATAHDFSLGREDPPTYRLTGTVTTPSTGWTVEIHQLSDGIVPDPGIARFLVHVTPPADDVVVQPVVTDHAVELAFEDEPELATGFVHLQGATDGKGGTDVEVPVA